MLQANCSAVTFTAVNSDYQPRREVQNDYVFTFETGPASNKPSRRCGSPRLPSENPVLRLGWSDPPPPVRSILSIRHLTTASNVVSVNSINPRQVADTSQNFAKAYALETASFFKDHVIAILAYRAPLRVWEELVEL